MKPMTTIMLVLAALALASCQLGPNSPPSTVSLLLTQNFGARVAGRSQQPAPSGRLTLLGLLQSRYPVAVSAGAVRSIDGLSTSQRAGWSDYVNGVEASTAAADTAVHPGDHIWWDSHDHSQTDSVPAVVGSFPEPFLNGIAGKRLPVRVECVVAFSYPCRRVLIKLGDLGIPAALAALGPGDEPQSLRILVGPFSAVSGDPAAQSIERGPRASGVYARFSPNAATLTLLGERGRVARVLGAGAGLIAATRYAEEAPVWVITGTDEAGVREAAQRFDQRTLEGHFAVAFAPGGAAVALPLSSG
jgi:hypothetical protein